TTLLENWDLDAERDISDNHMMFGEIGGWFFKSIGGILPDPEKPGFKNIIFKPIFPEGLDQSDVRYISPYGEIQSTWPKEGDSVYYDIGGRPNASATFYMPINVHDSTVVQVAAGSHRLKMKLMY